jgi:hypothetical protein
MKGGDKFIPNTKFLVPPPGADQHQTIVVDTMFGPMELMAPDLTDLKYNDVIEIGFKNDEKNSEEKSKIKKELKESHGNTFRYIHGARGIGEDFDLYDLDPQVINQLWILGFQSMQNKLEFIRIVVEENGEYVLFDRTINEELESASLLYSTIEDEKIKLIANKASPDSYIRDDDFNKILRKGKKYVPFLQTIAAKRVVELANEQRANVHAIKGPNLLSKEIMKVFNADGNSNVDQLRTGGKRRTKRRRSNKKRTNKRKKKTKTRMKKIKTSKKKTNKRRRKR